MAGFRLVCFYSASDTNPSFADTGFECFFAACMTYEETLAYLYERLPMFTRIGAVAYKKDLHNTLALLENIGNPHTGFKSIHVAGTNGKGSTSHMLAAIFQANGYKTGLYTSPHLKDFRERIKVNGEFISESFVVDFTKRTMPAIEVVEPSFFEVTVAMAFSYFYENQVDIAIIETGLGGRLDSTNVIAPELGIITNIGWDHMNLLGDSLGKIAFEKAGIIKPGVPVVIGESLPETKAVFEDKAIAGHSPISFAEELMEISNHSQSMDGLTVTYVKDGNPLQYHTDLPGIYQQYNLRTVLTAIEVLKESDWQFSSDRTRYALGHVKELTGLHGRWELIRKNPFVVLDVGHNEDGIKQVIRQITAIAEKQVTDGNTRIVIGMVKDKEVEKVLALFPKTYHFYFTNAHLPRALSAVELQQKAAVFGLHGNAYGDVNQAITAAIANSGTNELIVVCGSVFVVGEVETDLFM